MKSQRKKGRDLTGCNARVSIIIPAHNAEETLSKCLEACLHQTYEQTELIVVDDGSSDDTPRIAQSYPVHYLRQEQSGPAAARNRGAREASGEILVFTDSDCVPANDWIAQLMQGFDGNVVAVGGTYAIANPESLLARMIQEEIAVRHAQFNEQLDFLGSFNMAVRRDAFNAAGGFDESFRAASAEDNDLSYRLQRDGAELRFAPNAVVAHYHPTRLIPYLKTQAKHGFWRVKLYAKHPNRGGGDQYAGLLDMIAPALLMLIAAAAIVSLFSATIRSHALWLIVFAAVLVLLRTEIPWRMFRRSGNSLMLAFSFVIVARDAARAIGMLSGIYSFVLRKRKTA